MLNSPRKTKYRKFKKRYIRAQLIETKTCTLLQGSVGLKLLESVKLNIKQLESIRQCINRNLERKGYIWIRAFPYISISSKPAENRMGKGKGNVSHWVSIMKAGSILLEITGVPSHLAINALKQSYLKLPIKSKIVYVKPFKN